MSRVRFAKLMLAYLVVLLIAQPGLAAQYYRHHTPRALRSIYPGALHYGWRWIRVPTAVGAPTGGAPLPYDSGGYIPAYGAAYPFYSAGYSPGYGCSMDYHFAYGFCYPN